LVTILIVLNRTIFDTIWPIEAATQHVLILGTGELAVDVAREISKRGDLSIRLAGFVREAPAEASHQTSLFGHPIIGSADDLESLASQHEIARVIVAVEDRRGRLPTRPLVKLRVQGVRIEDAHSAIAGLTGRVWLQAVRPSWFVFSDGFYRS